MNNYTQYKKGLARTRELAAPWAANNPLDTELAVADIQTALHADGFHVRKIDIEKILSDLQADYFSDAGSYPQALSEEDLAEQSDDARQLTKVMGHFENLVKASPVHPFEVTPLIFFTELYRGAGIVLLMDHGSDEGHVEFIDEPDFADSFTCGDVFWPMPIRPGVDFRVERAENKQIEANVAHWHYCQLSFKLPEDHEPLLAAITGEGFSLIWAAARSLKEIDIMVRVLATDRASWEAEAKRVTELLVVLGASEIVCGFKNLLSMPDHHQDSQLIYFAPALVEKPAAL